MTVLRDSELDPLLIELHEVSERQIALMVAEHKRLQDEGVQPDAAEVKHYMSDKFVALDRDKAEFCYQLCRATNARRIVEAGTSFGVSTIYLAAALRDNIRTAGGTGFVIGTEYERDKVKAAEALFKRARLDGLIELREGDLRDTLQQIDSPIDFMLVDIWIDIALPALKLVYPHLKQGAIVICDNTDQYRSEYAEYFEFINDPVSCFRTVTLPFKGGLEMSVRC